MTTVNILKKLGYATIDETWYKKIEEWDEWYRGDVKKFHHYEIRNSDKIIECQRYSLGMGKKIPEDWASLLMNEKVSITLEGETEQAFIDRVFSANNFEVKANEMQEAVFALGIGAFVPRAYGITVNAMDEPTAADGVKLDYVTASHIFPLAWENGIITECAFDSPYFVDGKRYLYLQIHKREANGNYVIENHIFSNNNGNAGEELPPVAVRGFENVPANVLTLSPMRQFVIDRPNIANNIEPTIPMGISVYANAIDVMRGVDIAYDSYVNEFRLGKKRIMVKPSATKYRNGQPVFDSDDVTFYVLPQDIDGDAAITPIDMTLRTSEHSTGIQDQLNILSAKCGFGENHYSFDHGSIQTATQVISQNSTLFRTIKKHEIVLESCLIELCRIILRLGNTYMNAGLDEDVEISIDFDDSIVEDKQSDFNRTLQLLSAGIINDWEARMVLMNEDEETAKAALPKMDALATEEQTEEE